MANTKIQTAAANKAAETPTNLQGYLKMYKKEFEKALPKMITPERFTRMAMTALTANATLRECTPPSFIGACLTAAQLGLEPNTPLGQAYLIPYKNYKNNGRLECQFQIGYKGLLDLAYRSGIFQTVMAQVVYENDDFTYEYGLEPKLCHKPAARDRGNMTYVYAVYKLNNGGYTFEVMSVEDVRDFAKKKSKSYSSGPWQTDFEMMAKKTVLKRLLKYAPLKTEQADGINADNTVFNADVEAAADMGTSLDITATYTEVDEETGEITETEDETPDE